MGRKKVVKAKEPIRFRFKTLKNGNTSIYLLKYDPDTDANHHYSYEHLKLFLVPEVDEAARVQNINTMQAANAIKAQRLIEYANGKAGLKTKRRLAKNLLLIDWIKKYRDEKQKLGQSKSNAVTINNVLLHLIKYKGDKVTMAQVTKEYCKGFVLYLANGKTIGTDKPTFGQHHEKPMAKSTARLYFNTFVTALNEAVREGVLEMNPTAKLKKEEKKPIQRGSAQRGFLEVEEVKALANTPCPDPTVKMAFLFSCFCGLRISDIKTLKWGEIKSRSDGWVIEKLQVKTQQAINVPLSANALEWLPDRGQAKDESLVFALPSYFTINRYVKRWAKEAEIKKDVTFHIASHSKIFYLLNISELSTLKNVTANDLETSYILFLSQLCNIQRTL